MVITRRRERFPGLGDAQTVEDLQRQFIQVPMDAARAPALATVSDLAALFELLPDAFANSQRRELARITAIAGEDDPRAVRLQNSLDQMAQVKTLAQRGRTRVERFTSVRDEENVFHGFVTDPDSAPIQSVTVRMTSAQGARLSGTTDADGYFRINFGTRRRTRKAPRNRAAAESVNAQKDATVEIVRASTVLQRDPVPVATDEGRVYREYVIVETTPPPRRAQRRRKRARKSGSRA